MYKIIMVDDEDIVLNTIPHAIDWHTYGLEIVAVFNDSEAALDYISNHPVDGIFTDIQMPVMNGLELISNIRKNHSDIVIFIISAYSKFDYAQEAINYDVAGYLLKPLNFKNLSDACKKMKEKLDKIHSQKRTNYFNSNQCPNKLQKLISDYTTKKQLNILPDISCAFSEYNYIADTDNFPCAIVSVTIMDLPEYLSSTWTHERETLFVALNQMMVCDNLYIFPLYQAFDKFELLILSKTPSMQQFQCALNEFKNSYTTNCFENLNLMLSIEILSAYTSMSQMNIIVSHNNYSFNKLLDFIVSGDEKSAIETFNDIVATCTNEVLPDLNNFLYTSFINQLGFDHLIKSNIYPKHKNSFNDNYSYNETLSIIKEASLCFKSRNAEIPTIHTAKQYIDNHYNENLSLTFISELIYMSVSQFTRTFRKEFNISFLTYLNNVRIERACHLLSTTKIPSNVICGMVGYTSYSYFSKKFKQHTNQTIADYRQAHQKNIPN